LKRWVAYYRLEAFGNHWRRTARQTAVLAAEAGARLNEDAEEMFMPGYDPTAPTQTDEEMLAELMKIPQFARQANG
jgi:hypothetical protein